MPGLMGIGRIGQLSSPGDRPTFGPNQLLNGGFDTDTVWGKYNSSTGNTATISGGLLRCVADGTGFPYGSQPITTIPGVTYEIGYDFSWQGVSGIVRAGPTLGSIADLNFVVVNATPSTGKAVRFTASGSTTHVSFWVLSTSSGAAIFFDNVSARRVY